ncbi:vacuolar protein sorting 53 [Pyricularia oryzae]|nr:vacuolar protein sorting 53 [Pyricularia oryzae]
MSSSSASRKSRKSRSGSSVMYTNAVYFPNHHIYKGDTPGQLNYSCISHVFYAHAQVSSDGSVLLSDEWADAGASCDGVKGGLGSLMYLKQKHPHLLVVLSVGGGNSSEIFPHVAASAVRRDNFARSAQGLVDASGLDGIDVDWEYPSDPQQGADFVALLAAARLYLTEDRYILTAALPAGISVLQNINLAMAADYLDYINIKAYDLYGSWTHKCGHHAQLYAKGKDESSGSSTVHYLLSRKVPAKKILLGIPIYGRSFLNTTGPGHRFKGTGGEHGVFEYRQLPRKGTREQVDKGLVAAQCVGGDGGFVTYDNPETVKMKATYCKQKGLGGLFYWAGPADSKDIDYDPVQHLNLLFNHPASVTSIEPVSAALQAHKDGLSTSIVELETEQAYGPSSSLERMQSAQAELAGLFKRIESVRTRALQTERNITTMTADIKRLDGTKRNLTLSMTALKRLQMLTTAYEQLRGLARSRQYRECAGLLQAVLQLMKHFNSYRSIEQIAVLSRNVSELQRELLEQVCEDFELAFAKGDVTAHRPTLVEACQVMDALGDNARARLVTWYVNTELREYRQVFRGNDEAGSLDNIGRRFAWFRRTLKTHEEEHAAIFPPHWRVNETLAAAFCDGTRDDLKGVLERSMRRPDASGKIDVNLLLSCLQETMDFEQSIERRFASEMPRASIDTLSSADERGTHTFNGSISVAFEPYLSLWVESQDRQLGSMIPKYRTQPLIPDDEEFSPQAVIPSAIELFHFYKTTLSQCAKLSTGDRLLDLTKIFSKYLDEYAQQVLLGFLQRGGPQGPAIEDTILVLNTADFWHTNTNQLEENIRKRVDPELAVKVDLSSQSDAFLGVASAAVLALVHKVEAGCEGAWREMKNTNWSRMEGVGDQSSYVAELLKHVNNQAEEILPLVVKQQYARAFCDNLVEQMASAYIANIVLCRPVSEMLLDKYVLTKSFESLMSYHTHSNPEGSQYTPSASFVKRVNQIMSRIDPLLKTLQVRASPPEGLVQAYLIHIGDKSDTNFRKILDLKGLRSKADQAHLVELFTIHKEGTAAPGGKQLVMSSPLLTPLMASSGFGGGGAMATNPGLDAASSIGEKLLSAARDTGVTGLGVSIPGGAGGGNPQVNINENLKNIGKFFRRDIGGLGARFGKRDVTPTGSGGADDGGR